MTDEFTKTIQRLKTEEQIIGEIQDKINTIKSRGYHSYYAMNMLLEDGVAQKIEKHFKEHGCYYVRVESCGCANKTYDIMIQW